jgi:Flp pilus assembly pilin Flp
MQRLIEFWQDERGQDTVEYALLLAFIVLASAALYIHNSKAIANIWGTTNENLALADK